jgi:hypothetical protein
MKKIIVLGVIASVGLTTNAIAQKKSEAKSAAIKSAAYKSALPTGAKYIDPKNMNVKVKQLTLENEVVKIWDQLKDIEKELGYLKTNIVKCCRKKQLTAYGYKWEYADNTEYDNIYPTTARKKSQNNRVGIYVTNGTETLLFRTITEVAEKYGYHKSTIQAYISNKRQHKFLKFEYAKWN